VLFRIIVIANYDKDEWLMKQNNPLTWLISKEERIMICWSISSCSIISMGLASLAYHPIEVVIII